MRCTRPLRGGSSEVFLLAHDQHAEQRHPGYAHRMPVPSRHVYGNLAQFHSFEVMDDAETYRKGENSQDEMGRVQTSDDVEEIAGGR